MSARTGPYPIRELISREVLRTLEGVTEAAGFNVTFTVERFRKQGNDAADLKLIVHDGADRIADADDTPDGHEAKWGLYELQIYVFEAEASDVDYDTRVHVAAADAERAVMSNPSMGALAEHTRMLSPLLFEEAEDAAGVVVRFECLYVHLTGNPYSRHGE